MLGRLKIWSFFDRFVSIISIAPINTDIAARADVAVSRAESVVFLQANSIFLYEIFTKNLKLPSALVSQKIVEVFDYINSELIEKHHIKRLGVIKFFKNLRLTLARM